MGRVFGESSYLEFGKRFYWPCKAESITKFEQQYPSGRKVQNTLDTNGDLEMVRSRKNSNFGYWAYANNFTYNAAGALTSMQLGNGRWESMTFNSRLQPTQIALGVTPGATNLLDLDYTYGTTANNGNVLSQTITVPSVGATAGFISVQSYNYDSLNRSKQAEEKPQGWTDTNCTSDPTKCWKQTFTFDRYGNRRFDEANTTMPSSFANQALTNPTISTSNNRLSSTGWSYDSSGNTTADPSGRSFVYDAENKQVSVSGTTGTIGEYFYDGDGRRVKKYVPSTGETTVFVYDAASKLIAEYSTVVASSNEAKVAYLTNDHLGSPRINTDANGAVTARHDYHPFGEEIATSQRSSALGYASDAIRKQFTGYERDNETGLDFAEARMYSNSLGRFTGTDPMALKAAFLPNPQNTNRYAYTRNNPLTYVDSAGLCPVPALQKGQVGICIEAFIAAPRIGGIGHGDNRTHGEQGTARARFMAVISTTETSFDVDTRGSFVGESSVTGGPTLPGRGRIEGDVSSTAPKGSEGFGDGQNTSTMVRIEMTGITNGYQAAAQDVQTAGAVIGNSGSPVAGAAIVIAGQTAESLAPGGTIDVSAQVRITGSGDNIRVKGWGQSRPYPSVTGYAFTRNADGSITRRRLFGQDETKPEDLKKPKRPIN